MKLPAVRAMIFGLISGTLAGVFSAALAQLASLPYIPDPLAWPFLLFFLGGVPLSFLLDLSPGFQQLQWHIFPAGGAAPAFASVLVASLATWSLVIAICRLAWLRKRRLVPNNSFKRTRVPRAA